MLFLLFQLGTDRYALEASQIAEVLPLVTIKEIPGSPVGVVGAFSYRGTPVPLIDLNALVLGRPARVRISTRIVLVYYPADSGDLRLLGLIAEKATETIRRQASDFSPSGITSAQAPYLGPVTSDAHGVIQWLEVDKLLPESVRRVLFQTPVEAEAR